MINKSKAQMLFFLEKKVTKSKILPLLIFSADTNIELIVLKIKQHFKSKIIIRSSSLNEDTENNSNAGYYESILNINTNDDKSIKNALNKVISSYKDEPLNKNEILIQPMLKDVILSGVLFTCDINTLSPYYIINYDISENTSNVTSGKGKNIQTYIEYKFAKKIQRNNIVLDKLIEAVKELEILLNNSFLDIEFAYDGYEIYIFQVRSITKGNKKYISKQKLEKALYKLHKKIKKLNAPHPNLLGDKTLFGVMPDWNPAEIIGKKPKTLALTLYKELITDSTWAYQRDNYGYRNLRSHPLLISLLGVAYIDVRVSFNSFIPKTLNETIAKKLVNYYLQELEKNPHNHDKIEFEIIFSCIDFNTNNKLYDLLTKGFNIDEIADIKNSLTNLTNNIFTLYKKDLKKITKLEKKHSNIINSNLELIDKIYWLNEYCKRYGTLPFAGLARAGFIAMSFLKSFISQNIITSEEYNRFLNSLQTVAKDLSQDLSTMTKKDFLKKYGHLRPGTYDILSDRYDKKYDFYFESYRYEKNTQVTFNFNKSQLLLIDYHLKNNGLKISAESLIDFIKEAIEAREFAKFTFTKTLSQILVFIEELGGKFFINKNDICYLDYKEILNLYSSLWYEDVSTIFNHNINQNKDFFELTKAIKLPDLITCEQDIYNFLLTKNSPNFITLNVIESNIIKEEDIFNKKLENAIICIKSADPGYDFLFTKKIGGLITSYGGVNSHMAIRCSELNIPAVIGIGEDEYKKISNSKVVKIDCKCHMMRTIL